MEDTQLIDGIVFPQRAANINGPKRVEKAKIGFIQFCISPPKTDMDHNVIVSDYAAMDRVLKEERSYILNIVKQIKKSGCNVLLVSRNTFLALFHFWLDRFGFIFQIQKSILRDAVSDLALHFLDKIKVLVVKDIEREDVEFVCKSLSCRPIASLDHFTAENLSNAEMVEEVGVGQSRMVKITGTNQICSLKYSFCAIKKWNCCQIWTVFYSNLPRKYSEHYTFMEFNLYFNKT